MAQELTALRNRAALRRVLAVVCAIAFLIVSFAHGVQHGVAGSAEGGYEVSLTGPDGGEPPHSTDAAHSGGHCHGCVMLGIVDPGAQLTDRPDRQPFPTISVVFSPVILPSESPYPISAI